MIDWVSIVRHSRRRFSSYMYAMPSKVRRLRKHQLRAQQRLLQQQQQRYDDENRGYEAVEPPPRARFSCSCCIPSRKSRRKYRYPEEVDLPPTSSRLKDVDGLGTSVDHYSSSAVESPRKVSGPNMRLASSLWS
ncbi:uncharacterized protein LOC119386147 [Rhipicephalus sanguineus]|uniref:uncharacterized protein LOC119386147 n=1 Tax=Rhipicephalus sanguineus TaxID=34632 RepID=UPI0020C478B0|nr:uncharacterized protein LOC119386147 [Rhipicephalus sanguineus]